MLNVCDNKSVGVIIKKDDTFAVIKRRNYPVAYAFVAGHLDGDTFEDAAKKEALEEVRISVEELSLKLDEQFPNPCKRDGGDGHHWQVFEAVKWSGELQSGSDAKEAFWVTPEELRALADVTFAHAKKKNIPPEKFPESTPLFVEDEEWQKDPGLEPVWVVMLKKIGVL